MLKRNKRGNLILETEAVIPYELAVGDTWNRFFEGFRNEKIYGTRCQKCKRVLVPARKFCAKCYVDMEEWVELGNEGEIFCWSLTNYRFFGMPTEPPFITGFIKIDKADNLFVHLIGGFDMSDLDWIRTVMKRGTRVTAVWEKVKNGCIMDIKYFKPLFVA